MVGGTVISPLFQRAQYVIFIVAFFPSGNVRHALQR